MTRREVTANIPRLHAFMDEAGLDAVVVRSGVNFAYLSGVVFPGTLARHQDLADSMRGVLLLWPRRGEPVIVANGSSAGLARRDAWVETVVLYESYVESPYRKLAHVITDAGLASARIGFERDFVSARDWEGVARDLPHIEMIDCADLLSRVRSVKTRGEVELLRTAADLLDDAYREVFERIRPGTTERRIHADMIGTLLAKGFEWAHGILNSDKNSAISYAGESDVVIDRGDVIRTDYAAYRRAYPGHQSRCAIVGPPTAAQRDEYRAVRDVYRATVDRCRPGTRADAIYGFVMGEFAKRGWPYTISLVGHGVGPWWHQQPPILRRGSTEVLEAGMVLAVEPVKAYWHIQDLILVRHGPPELLSAKFCTDEPFVVAH